MQTGTLRQPTGKCRSGRERICLWGVVCMSAAPSPPPPRARGGQQPRLTAGAFSLHGHGRHAPVVARFPGRCRLGRHQPGLRDRFRGGFRWCERGGVRDGLRGRIRGGSLSSRWGHCSAIRSRIASSTASIGPKLSTCARIVSSSVSDRSRPKSLALRAMAAVSRCHRRDL